MFLECSRKPYGAGFVNHKCDAGLGAVAKAAGRRQANETISEDAFLTLAVHCIDRHLSKIDAS
jgi:hypothetical protein